MNPEQRRCFHLLRKAVEARFQEAHAPFDMPITDWKGQDILNFQEHLLQEVKGQVSEKWFYTHIKQDHDRLPRIDVLNLLAGYVGEQSWAQFCGARREIAPEVQTAVEGNRPWRSVLVGTLVAMLLLTSLGSWYVLGKEAPSHRFCLVDADSGEPIALPRLQVWLDQAAESPQLLEIDPAGCVEVTTAEMPIRLIIQGAYILPDTIVRYPQTANSEEHIPLYADDYARMLHYFSTNQEADWQARRAQLEQMFDPEVYIIQVYPENQRAMELYTREAFINKLSLPIPSLKQMEIVETRYEAGRLTYVRFYQLEK
ncbi:MAG: hypothetical protein AAF399_21425 [Bacteroidota bacterium]